MDILHDFLLTNSLQTFQLAMFLKPTSLSVRVGKFHALPKSHWSFTMKTLVCQIILQSSFSVVSLGTAQFQKGKVSGIFYNTTLYSAYLRYE